MAEGAAAAGFILEKAGVNPAAMASTVYREHPGGKAIENLEQQPKTEIKGLFVDDASVTNFSETSDFNYPDII